MTPVQIPFKRNFKDMENKFEYLKIDGREQLPAPWSDYPVLREYETVTVYRNGRDYLDALVGHSAGCSATRNCGVPHGRPCLIK